MSSPNQRPRQREIASPVAYRSKARGSLRAAAACIALNTSVMAAVGAVFGYVIGSLPTNFLSFDPSEPDHDAGLAMAFGVVVGVLLVGGGLIALVLKRPLSGAVCLTIVGIPLTLITSGAIVDPRGPSDVIWGLVILTMVGLPTGLAWRGAMMLRIATADSGPARPPTYAGRKRRADRPLRAPGR